MFSKTIKADELEHSVQSEQAESGQCKKRKFIYQKPGNQPTISENASIIPKQSLPRHSNIITDKGSNKYAAK